MRLLFLADLHLLPDYVLTMTAQLEEVAREVRPDGVIIAGDLSECHLAEESCARLRALFPERPIAVTLGNHDYWIRDRPLESTTLPRILFEYWEPAARRQGIHLLDLANLDLGPVVVCGAYAHFDLGHAQPGLIWNGKPVTDLHYATALLPGDTKVYWSDMLYMPRVEGDAAIARRELAGFATRYTAAVAEGKPVLCALHTVPFSSLNGHRDPPGDIGWFRRAYSGNAAIGRWLTAQPVLPALVVCGHTHCPVPLQSIAGMPCINLGSDYGRLRWYAADY